MNKTTRVLRKQEADFWSPPFRTVLVTTIRYHSINLLERPKLGSVVRKNAQSLASHWSRLGGEETIRRMDDQV